MVGSSFGLRLAVVGPMVSMDLIGTIPALAVLSCDLCPTSTPTPSLRPCVPSWSHGDPGMRTGQGAGSRITPALPSRALPHQPCAVSGLLERGFRRSGGRNLNLDNEAGRSILIPA